MTTRRAGAPLALALLLGALGCGASSRTTFDDAPGQGGTGGTAGATTTGGTSGSSGDVASGGVSSGGTAGGGAVSGSGGTPGGGAGIGAASGTGGTSSAGVGGMASAGTSATGGAGAAGVDISGMWAMFVFEDPVVVNLRQSGSTLTGTGCCVWNELTPIDCCGDITGTVADGHASFSFPPGDFSSLASGYSADVYVSANGERLGGGFGVGTTTGRRMAWVRPNNGARLQTGNLPLAEAAKARAGTFELELELASARTGGLYVPNTVYRLTLESRGDEVYVYGDLGPFWGGEMDFSPADDTITAGPVPDTDPTFPTTLELAFDDGVLSQVTATYPNDAPYVFVATPTAN